MTRANLAVARGARRVDLAAATGRFRALVVGALGLVGPLTGCLSPLDNASTVHDLRILAIASDPPELRYPVQGTVVQDLFGTCTPDLTPLAAQTTVTLRALVGDPQGGGRSLHYRFSVCPQTSTERCPDGGGYALGEVDGPAPEVAFAWPFAQFAEAELASSQSCRGEASCPATPLVAAIAANPQGLCRFGVWLQIALEVEAPDGQQAFGAKLLVFTPVPADYPKDASVCPQGVNGGPPPHQNPLLTNFSLDGQALPLDSIPQVSAAFAHTLRPRPPSAGPQPYCVPTYDGKWLLQQETWVFDAETDVGSFDRQEVGGAQPLGSDQTGPSTDLNFTWSIPEDGGVGKIANLYEVTRDGRGGQSWVIRQAQVIP